MKKILLSDKENHEDASIPNEHEDGKADSEKVKLPEESGTELLQKQVVIPSPYWEPFIKKEK